MFMAVLNQSIISERNVYHNESKEIRETIISD